METLKQGTRSKEGTATLFWDVPTFQDGTIVYSCHNFSWESDHPSDQAAVYTVRAACKESVHMGLDRGATHLRRSFGSADGIAASVVPHFATSWTAPYPNSLGRCCRSCGGGLAD